MTKFARYSVVGLVIAAIAFFGARLGGLPESAQITAAIGGLVAGWWIFEPIPIPATSILPFVLLPAFGILSNKQAAASLGHYMILLLLGGFILSKGVERSLLHRRIAFSLVKLFGRFGRKGLVLGFMVATAACSMWISNTATVLVLLPVAMALLDQDEDGKLRIPLILGIAYSASIGGLGTPIGTPPNIYYISAYKEQTGIETGFLEWMSFGLPIVVVFLPVAWLWLTRHLGKGDLPELPHLLPWTVAEKRVLLVFATTATLWCLRSHPFGGWQTWVGLGSGVIGDDTIALFGASLLFLVPDGMGSKLLTWKEAEKIPWGLLLLFAGGICLAAGFKESGLSMAIGHGLEGISHWSFLPLTFAVALCVTFLTEVTSNTATTILLLPILGSAAAAAHMDPRVLMIPAVLSASFAFMLPVATAPNAIMYGTDRITVKEMAREGLVLNIVGAFLTTLIVALFVY